MAPSKDDSTHRIRVRDAYNAPERGKSHAFSPSFMIEAVKTKGRTATTYFATTCQVRDREREKERHKGTKGIRSPRAQYYFLNLLTPPSTSTINSLYPSRPSQRREEKDEKSSYQSMTTGVDSVDSAIIWPKPSNL